MYNFQVLSSNKAHFKIDIEIFSQSVISRVLYWLSSNFVISQQKLDDHIEVFLTSTSVISDWADVEMNISQLFNDYRLREIIDAETKDIRTVLYVKAFANLDDFEEYGV